MQCATTTHRMFGCEMPEWHKHESAFCENARCLNWFGNWLKDGRLFAMSHSAPTIIPNDRFSIEVRMILALHRLLPLPLLILKFNNWKLMLFVSTLEWMLHIQNFTIVPFQWTDLKVFEFVAHLNSFTYETHAGCCQKHTEKMWDLTHTHAYTGSVCVCVRERWLQCYNFHIDNMNDEWTATKTIFLGSGFMFLLPIENAQSLHICALPFRESGSNFFYFLILNSNA